MKKEDYVVTLPLAELVSIVLDLAKHIAFRGRISPEDIKYAVELVRVAVREINS